jgi:hypothetical protein
VPGAAAANITVTELGPGYGIGVAVGIDGLGLAASLDVDPDDPDTLKITHCSNVACTSHTSVHFSVHAEFQDPAIAIGSDGRAIIAYIGDGKLKTVHCNNTPCTSLSHTSHAGIAGQELYPPVSLAIDGSGLAVMSYIEVQQGMHRLARCVNVACTSVTVKTIAPIGEPLYAASNAVTTGVDGGPLVVFEQFFKGPEADVVKVFRCVGWQCNRSTTSLLTSSSRMDDSVNIATGADGLGLIVYSVLTPEDKTTWKVAHCSNASCSATITSTLESFSPGTSFGRPSIAMRTLGGKLPVIVYGHSAGPQLRIAYCTNTNCSLSLKFPLYVSSDFGDPHGGSPDASLALDADDRPLFGFLLPEPTRTLFVGHCNVKTCL